jgi:sugar lactone lactonase YvrE
MPLGLFRLNTLSRAIAAIPVTGWDLSTVTSDTKVFFTATQTPTSASGIAFKSDGTKMYVFGTNVSTRRIFQYTLSTAWDNSTAVYDSVFYDVTESATTAGLDIQFKPDGTKMYILSNNSTVRSVTQFDLSTAWDISTASKVGDSVSVNSQGSNQQGIAFKDDGTKMYMSTYTAVFQYTLSTAWALSTLSYDSVTFSTNTQETTATGVQFRDDGVKMYIVGVANDTIFQYNLTTAWDLSTASYDSVSLRIAHNSATPRSLKFKPDGTMVYVINSTGSKINRYGLNTAWSLTDRLGLDFFYQTQETTPNALFLKPDGTKMYIVGTANDRVYQYTLSTAWRVSTASYDGVNDLVSSQENTPSGLFFKPDGTKMYIVGTANDRVYQYTLSTAWSINTATYDSVSSITVSDTTPTGLFFKPDGTKMYTVGSGSDVVRQFALSTAWNVSTATLETSSPSLTSLPSDLFFKDDGTILFIIDSGTDRVYEYVLSTAWDVSTAVTPSTLNYSVSLDEATPTSLFFKDDGTRMYILGTGQDTVVEYNLG